MAKDQQDQEPESLEPISEQVHVDGAMIAYGWLAHFHDEIAHAMEELRLYIPPDSDLSQLKKRAASRAGAHVFGVQFTDAPPTVRGDE